MIQALTTLVIFSPVVRSHPGIGHPWGRQVDFVALGNDATCVELGEIDVLSLHESDP